MLNFFHISKLLSAQGVYVDFTVIVDTIMLWFLFRLIAIFKCKMFPKIFCPVQFCVFF